MEVFAQQRPSVSVMPTLNRCRLYLQVFTVSDIATADGIRITKEAKQGIRSKIRPSRLMWPAQGRPSNQEWAIWTRHLAHLEDRHKLRQPLGK
jgi:hypothetical protein